MNFVFTGDWWLETGCDDIWGRYFPWLITLFTSHRCANLPWVGRPFCFKFSVLHEILRLYSQFLKKTLEVFSSGSQSLFISNRRVVYCMLQCCSWSLRPCLLNSSFRSSSVRLQLLNRIIFILWNSHVFISGEQRGHSPQLIALSPRSLTTNNAWLVLFAMWAAPLSWWGWGGGMGSLVIGKVFKNPCQNIYLSN